MLHKTQEIKTNLVNKEMFYNMNMYVLSEWCFSQHRGFKAIGTTEF